MKTNWSQNDRFKVLFCKQIINMTVLPESNKHYYFDKYYCTSDISLKFVVEQQYMVASPSIFLNIQFFIITCMQIFSFWKRYMTYNI